ncbi:MAG TPA: plasmid stabilization protein [Bacteroidetes bacterium]|nr:plasmid stabilization protein [Bacteroidota bacterium]
MFEVILSDHYKKIANKFLRKHPEIYPQYKKTLLTLRSNPYHPSLRLHKLQGKLQDYYSVSINLQYRIMLDFIIKGDKIILIDIGKHDQMYR